MGVYDKVLLRPTGQQVETNDGSPKHVPKGNNVDHDEQHSKVQSRPGRRRSVDIAGLALGSACQNADGSFEAVGGVDSGSRELEHNTSSEEEQATTASASGEPDYLYSGTDLLEILKDLQVDQGAAEDGGDIFAVKESTLLTPQAGAKDQALWNFLAFTKHDTPKSDCENNTNSELKNVQPNWFVPEHAQHVLQQGLPIVELDGNLLQILGIAPANSTEHSFSLHSHGDDDELKDFANHEVTYATLQETVTEYQQQLNAQDLKTTLPLPMVAPEIGSRVQKTPPEAQPEGQMLKETGMKAKLRETLRKRKLENDENTAKPPPKQQKVVENKVRPHVTPIQDKKLRRRVQNRNAARTFREKQKRTIDTLTTEKESWMEKNSKLRVEINVLYERQAYLKQLRDAVVAKKPQIPPSPQVDVDDLLQGLCFSPPEGQGVQEEVPQQDQPAESVQDCLEVAQPSPKENPVIVIDARDANASSMVVTTLAVSPHFDPSPSPGWSVTTDNSSFETNEISPNTLVADQEQVFTFEDITPEPYPDDVGMYDVDFLENDPPNLYQEIPADAEQEVKSTKLAQVDAILPSLGLSEIDPALFSLPDEQLCSLVADLSSCLGGI